MIGVLAIMLTVAIVACCRMSGFCAREEERQSVSYSKVDGLASETNGKVNTVPNGDKNMEEYT